MKKYQIIVVDPPWEIPIFKRKSRPRQLNIAYQMMTIEQIKLLPIKNIIDDFAILFLWTIDKYLFQSKDILEHWGFNYHLTMTWKKTSGMAMFGFQRISEFILVGLRGTHKKFPKRPTVKTCFEAKSTYHSEKPDYFYEMLDVLPFNPRIDMFARKKRDGLFLKNKWDVWGNEVESDIELMGG